MRILRIRSFLLLPFLVGLYVPLHAQEGELYYTRLYLKDKGTEERVLRFGDPLYSLATRHLTERAMQRRAKVLPADSLVTTDDLPVYEDYLAAIAATGAQIAQTSRWMNTVMVRTDSLTELKLLALPFIDRATRMVVSGARNGLGGAPFGKQQAFMERLNASQTGPPPSTGCFSTQYGLTTSQNNLIGIDVAHRMGIAGEGVLVGVLDAGFGWRKHVSLMNADVRGEHDFVYGDDNAADEPGEFPAEWHGTIVMSNIGAMWPDTLVGGAPRASFLLARTEDVRSELHIEEDNFVAGLEWAEAQGVDVTNTSLGYTTFDTPEADYTYDQLDGKTAFASRGVNHAVGLGVVCVTSAGNDFFTFRYVSVPGEADSAIAVAAVTSDREIAGFSSRGFGGRERIKPDVAAQGVMNFGADAAGPNKTAFAQGTSLAAPMVTSAVALLLSARPDLTPYQVRALLSKTSSHADAPDTAYGYGIVNVEAALRELSAERPVVGMPKALLHNGDLSIAAWVEYTGAGATPGSISQQLGPLLTLEITQLRTGQTITSFDPQPMQGLAKWLVGARKAGMELAPGDSIQLIVRSSMDGAQLRSAILVLTGNGALPVSTLCKDVPLPVTALSFSSPNPFTEYSIIEFALGQEAIVSLTVYNAIGQKVVGLIAKQTLRPGFHQAPFVPTNLPSGAYYYRLEVDDEVYSDELIYLR